MTRSEAVALVAIGLALLVAGLVWLFGPFGLLGAGCLLTVVALFCAEVRDDGGEALEPPTQPRG